MILLQVNQITKYFGAELILSNIKLEIQSNDRIAIVGRNGSGKSTLLKIIAGELSYDAGEIYKPKDVTLGYLDQHTGLDSERSIWDEMLLVFHDLQKMEKRLRELESQMADEAIHEDQARFEKIMKEYDQLLTEYKERGGYQYEAEIRSVLHGLNFSDYDYSTKISTLSGGQKTRLALGKLLLMKPDILILDEPTNHLDIDTLTWLEQYLANYDGAIVVVSHDRYFLDKLVTQVYECANHTLTRYVGNYSQYLEQKAKNYERQLKQYERQQEEIARIQEFIQRNIARASTTRRARSRRKALERMERIEKPQDDQKSARIAFEIERTSGNEVLKVSDLCIGYGKHAIAKDINFRITRGEAIALLGPNGIGKSTLLKTIARMIPKLAGTIQFGTNVTVAYYDQEQADLTSNKRVIDEIWDEYPDMLEKEIRSILGGFLFSGDDVLKPVSALSGGERARLALAKLTLKKANFLILDEPTNHLDLPSKEILENALIDYPGTILFVSHDRYFINRIATKVLELSEEGVTEYLGDYDYYVEKKQELAEMELAKKESTHHENTAIPDEKFNYERQKEIARIKRRYIRRIEEIQDEIEKLESMIEEKQNLLLQPEVYMDYQEAGKINSIIEEAKRKIDILLDEWLELENRLNAGVLIEEDQ